MSDLLRVSGSLNCKVCVGLSITAKSNYEPGGRS